ncbi:hypothetical protein FS749_012768 [Ceratobasidium sp. UAMH 11750]|nr:hypothetical protein FS749_012768 [Ceratobasidium sp. UAMH 11750]
MYIPLLPLITIATALQELTFSYLNYDRAADFIVWAAWGMVAGSATELVLGPVTFVRLQIEGRMIWPLTGDVRLSARLEAAPTPFSYFHPSSSSYEPTVNSPYLSLSPGGREPTRRLSALAPLRGFANGLSTDTTPLPLPLRTPPAGLAPLNNGLDTTAPNVGEGALPLPQAVTSSHPIISDVATSESVPAPPSPLASLVRDNGAVATSDPPLATPTPASPAHSTLSPIVGPPSSNPRWVPGYAWVLICAALVAILLDFAIGLYFTSPKTAELPGTPKNLRRREERGDQAPMMDDFDIPPTELRNPIELMARDHQAVHENPAIEARQPIDQGKYYSGPSSPDSSPLPGSPDAPREERVSSASVEMNSTPTTANSSAGIAAAYEDSAVLENPAAEAEPPKDQGKHQSAPLSPDSPLVVGPSDAPQEVDVFSASAGPNRAPATGPVRSSSVERWKTETRARDNVSPLAHKSLKRSSGSLGRVSLAPKSVGTQPGVPRPSRIAAGDSDSARPTTFDPAATPSSVCARQAGSSVVDRVQRATRNTDRE